MAFGGVLPKNTCKICLMILDSKNDMNLVHSTGKFNPINEIQLLNFVLPSNSMYICKECKRMLIRRCQARKSLTNIDEKIFRLAHGMIITDETMDEQSADAEGAMSASNEIITKNDNISINIEEMPNMLGKSAFSRPLIIEKSKNILGKETQKPLIIFRSESRKKVQIVQKVSDIVKETHFHDYCEPAKETKTSVTSSAPVIAISPTLTQTILLKPPQPILLKSPIMNTCMGNVSSPTSKAQQNPKLSVRKATVGTQTSASWAFPDLFFRKSEETVALVAVKWPKSERHKEVSKDLTHLAITLIRGTYHDIARAVWTHAEIQDCLLSLYQKAVVKESDLMCSEKYKSILKKNSAEDILAFTFEAMEAEMRERCPIFHSVLTAVAMRKNKDNRDDQTNWMSSICISASSCLSNRSVRMHALEVMLDMLEDGEKVALPKCVLKLRYIFVPE